MEPTLPEEVVIVQKGARYVVILSIVPLLIIAAGVISVWVRLSPEKTPFIQKPTETKSQFVEPTDSTPEFFEGNFTYSLQPVLGWERIDVSTVQLPQAVTKAYFGFRRSDGVCSIIYAGVDMDMFQSEYQQVSFGNRIVTTEHQFDPSWYAPKNSLPAGFAFSGEIRRVLPGEILPAYYPLEVLTQSNNLHHFVLFNESGNSIGDSMCADTFYEFIQSVVTSYTQATLTPESDGLVYFGIKPRLSGNREMHIMFTESGQVFPKEIMPTALGFDPSPAVYRGKLYVADKYTLSEVDLLKKTTTSIPNLNIKEGEVINDFYFHDGSLFALVGKSCTEYRSNCSNRLIEKKLDSTTPVITLATDLSARDIVGYDTEARKLYMVYVDGDAGVVWGEEYAYSVNAGVIEKGRNLNADPGFPEEQGIAAGALNRFPQQHKKGSVFEVKDGVLVGVKYVEASFAFPVRLVVD
ncbi:MAG TPA: hypothetical protein PLF31_01750 [Candidatus Paceibacterota bacterium]|nr:hypothetical protein [Candidatus Paceibacterota bacterium]